MMNRRRWLGSTMALGISTPVAAMAQPASTTKKRILAFTRSAGFQHDVAKLNGDSCVIHDVLSLILPLHGFEVDCTKDGRAFVPETIAKYDAFFFYTTGDLTATKSEDGFPPMPKEGKKALLDAIAAGKGFVGSHCASDTFHSKGDGRKNQDAKDIDPFIAMLGGEFISHGNQQKALMRVVSPSFPGLSGIRDFTWDEEWYSLKNFQNDLHVVLVQDTQGMKGHDYDRPSFPATWARNHGRGRVFYTSMGHRPDVWTKPLFHQLLLAAFAWTTGRVDFEPTPNMSAVTPRAAVMPPPPPPKEDKKK